MDTKPNPNETPEQRRQAELDTIKQSRTQPRPPGYYSNAIIQRRNGGVRHQFQDDIGGCSANYK